MSATILILTLTHIAAAFLGAVLCYGGVKRYTKVVDVDGHAAIEVTPKEERVGKIKSSTVLTIVISVAFVIIGLQVFQGQQESRSAEKEREERAKADRVYAKCIKDYTEQGLQSIVDTITIRNKGNQKVVDAERVRDDAVDNIIDVIVKFRLTPPQATDEDFGRALMRAAEAKARLNVAREASEEIKSDNEYEVPEFTCKR